MIKANELRKGVIIIDYTGDVREVTGRDIQQQCWHEEGQTGTLGAPLNPIELTPEWLDRLGFEKAKDEDSNHYETWSILKLDGVIAKQEDGWYQMITDVDGYYEQNVGVKLEFVHQLQNRYQSLTGEELENKMP